MEVEHFEMIAAMIIIGAIVVLAIKVQLSTIEGLGEVSQEWNKGENYKMAGIVHIMNQDEFNSLGLEDFRDRIQKEDGYCRIDEPNFGSSEPLRFRVFGEGCANVHEGVRAPIYFRKTGENEAKLLSVGGRN